MVEKIRVESLRYVRQRAEILAGVDVAVAGAEVTAVVGPSGAGKSTLLRTVNRLIEPTSGEVYLDGEPTGDLDTLALRRRVGMVLQLPALFGETVEDALLSGARFAAAGNSRSSRGATNPENAVDVRRLLERVGLGASLRERDPESLSVGQQQRVSVARSLALDPQALLMDEPTSSLDEAARRSMEALIRDLVDRTGLTVMLVSHDLDQVERVADSVVLLSDGRSVGQWCARDFFSAEGSEARRMISGEP